MTFGGNLSAAICLVFSTLRVPEQDSYLKCALVYSPVNENLATHMESYWRFINCGIFKKFGIQPVALPCNM